MYQFVRKKKLGQITSFLEELSESHAKSLSSQPMIDGAWSVSDRQAGARIIY